MKKFLKYLLLMLVALVVIFFSLGLFVPSFSYDNVIEVNKPADKAFYSFYNLGNMSKWIPGFQYIEPLSGFPDEVGSKLKMVLVQDGKKYIMIETMTAFKENEVFAFTLVNEVFTSDVEILFQGHGNTTTIIAHSKVKGKNIFWRALLLLSRPHIKSSQQQAYDKLKEVIETGN
jgi:hypothetical protein